MLKINFHNWISRINFLGIHLTKRQEFIIYVAFLTLGLITTQLVSVEQRLQFILSLAAVCLVLILLALREDLTGIEFVMLPILPVMFTVAIALFYYLLPVRWLTRLPFALLYALGLYALLLTENIYNVAANRSIQLLRAAHSVGFLITLITVFLLYDILFSFHTSVIINSSLTFIISLPLVIQSLWSMKLDNNLTREILLPSLVTSAILAQVACILSFWPIKTTIFALFLITVFYSLVGILREKLVDKLFVTTIREYLSVVVLTFILMLITARWAG